MDFKKLIENSYSEVMELEDALCRIPSPTGKEQKKAEFVRNWLSQWGEAGIDEAGNVIFSRFDDGSDGAYLFCAHMDTVFPDEQPFEPVIKDGKYLCPAAGDDTVNLACMMVLIKNLCLCGAVPGQPVIFAADTGEEGLGNLRGSRKLCETYGGRLRGFVSMDGTRTELVTGAVGSHRYRVTVKTPGGHSLRDFGNANAIAELSRLIERLYRTEVPTKARTTYNVGKIEGGSSVNVIADEASMLFEYRSEDSECLEYMRQRFLEAVEEAGERRDVSVTVETVGIRPCSECTDREGLERLASMAEHAVGSVLPEIKMNRHASSTDCNIPLSRGIPAVAFGLCEGSGAHTRDEYIELDSVLPGMRIGAAFLLNFFTIL